VTETTEIADVVIDEPERRSFERHPSDLLRLVVALLVTGIGFLFATIFNNVSEAVTVEVIEIVRHVPTGFVVVAIWIMSFFALLIPFLAIGYLIILKEWRRLFLGLLASAIAVGVLWLIEAELVRRFGSPELIFHSPEWVCTSSLGAGSATCVPGAGGLHIYYMAAGVAYFSSIAPWLSDRWRRFGWILIAVLVFFRMIQGTTPPLDELLIVGLSYAVGVAVLLIFGTPDRRPRGRAIVESLHRSGLELAELKRADVDARGSTPYFAKMRDGQRLFVKVLTPEERAADTMFRAVRMFRLKGVGDERPFSSLKRAVEHEAVGSLKAASDGVRTPRLEAIAEIEPSSVLMAYDMIDGSSLDGVPAEDLTDEVLAGIWDQVAILRSRRTAHRDLRLANVFLDDDGEPWLIDFGFAELAATDGQLRSDVAELVTSTSVVVGPERAVTSAIAGIGADAVADAATRIQPLALSGATRDALKRHEGLGQDLRDEVGRQTGVAEIELEDLERIKGRTVLMIVAFALVIYFLIPQLTETDFGAVFAADWAWLPAILLASAATFVGAAFAHMGAVPARLRMVPSILAQLAGTFVNRITPIKVGGMATSIRFMQKNGVDFEVAVAGVGVGSLAAAIVHVGLLILFVVLIGKQPGDFIGLPSHTVLLIGVISVVMLVVAIALVPTGRRMVEERIWPVIKKSGEGVRRVATSPTKILMLLGGAFVMIMGYILALWFSLEAFGGGLGFFAVGVVFLAAQALGQAAPTPGGIGAVEAAMIAAMTALGLDISVAVPTVFLYRIATFWLPILPGAWALKTLETDDAL